MKKDCHCLKRNPIDEKYLLIIQDAGKEGEVFEDLKLLVHKTP